MNDLFTKIYNTGIIPVIKIDDGLTAVPLARALVSGGIPCAEVTFRTSAAAAAIEAITAEVPDVLVGAGTVLTTEQADAAVKAGAKFIVTPGLNPRIVSYCLELGIPIIPGCANPSNIEAALELGLDTVKFFPAEQAGGLDYIKAIAAPYTGVKFMPTGGINASNLNKYLAFDKIIACGGSWMIDQQKISAGDFDGIAELCRAAVRSMHGFELGHIGINAPDGKEAIAAAEFFSKAFGFPVRDGNSAVFAGTAVEVVKAVGRGRCGHISLLCNNVSRARAYLERMGLCFDDSSEKRDSRGASIVYMRDEILGFAIHLSRK